MSRKGEAEMSILQKLMELFVEIVFALPLSVFNLTGGNVLGTALICALCVLFLLLGRASQPKDWTDIKGNRYFQLQWRNLLVIGLLVVLCVVGLSAVSGTSGVEPFAMLEPGSARF